MTTSAAWRPRHDDPLFILAMDHRGSFGTSLFGVQNDAPTAEQDERMRAAKQLMYQGLTIARPDLARGRAGVLVDEQYGQSVIDAARPTPVVVAVPIEASGHEWFTLAWGEQWLEHVRRVGPAYAKVLVRDNPDFDDTQRQGQLERLATVSSALAEADVPLLFELLVPATPAQLASVDADTDAYDRDVRPALVARVIADNQAAGVEPAVWKVEGLDTVAAARAVAAQARAGGRDVDLIVLGRDAPAERLHTWLAVAAEVEAFVGFAIGRSIWEQPIGDWVAGRADDEQTSRRIADRYLDFARIWH